ncbi:hypothetical protein C2S52_004812 [Perilla frutescens var. hirtella]|nr:hypothetical protein C2S51_010801 [Perilla frutescens var. frutescens]KAH6794335.1 hypothetical protein C2S52_004812 [Perilla frutescens var. hirtella]
MELHHDNQDSPACFIPLIARFDRLDRLIQLLEEKRSLSRSEFSAVEAKNECWTVSSALDQVQHKGTLMERLAILEKRVLEIDEGNTSISRSRSSSSTTQGSEMIGKKDSERQRKGDIINGDGDTITKQQMEHPSTIQAQERASPAHGIVKEIAAASHKRRTQKKKSQKWTWLFRHIC